MLMLLFKEIAVQQPSVQTKNNHEASDSLSGQHHCDTNRLEESENAMGSPIEVAAARSMRHTVDTNNDGR
jgi:hypothetical protein